MFHPGVPSKEATKDGLQGSLPHSLLSSSKFTLILSRDSFEQTMVPWIPTGKPGTPDPESELESHRQMVSRDPPEWVVSSWLLVKVPKMPPSKSILKKVWQVSKFPILILPRLLVDTSYGVLMPQQKTPRGEGWGALADVGAHRLVAKWKKTQFFELFFAYPESHAVSSCHVGTV